jgi:hypothetical protein
LEAKAESSEYSVKLVLPSLRKDIAEAKEAVRGEPYREHAVANTVRDSIDEGLKCFVVDSSCSTQLTDMSEHGCSYGVITRGARLRSDFLGGRRAGRNLM